VAAAAAVRSLQYYHIKQGLIKRVAARFEQPMRVKKSVAKKNDVWKNLATQQNYSPLITFTPHKERIKKLKTGGRDVESLKIWRTRR